MTKVLDSKKVFRVGNVIFKESEIQSLSAKESINTENPNLVSPIPVQDKVGGNNKATPVVQNQPETEGKPEEEKIPLHKAETVVHRKDMDYPTISK